jgi:sec-independent protein translocase protein TatC
VPRQPDEDLFEHTKMTFGEHLEELRWALIKAVAALAIGFMIGMYPPISAGLVEYVQTPLRAALTEHYRKEAEKEYRELLVKQREQGLPVPADIDAAAKTFANEGLVTDERYIDVREFVALLAKWYPELIDPNKIPPADVDQPLREKLGRIQTYYDLDRDPRLNPIGLKMEEAFVAYMKVALVLGFVLSSPFVFYFIWQFIAAGLYAHEQRYVKIFLPFSLGLFLAGAALAFFVAIRFVLRFLLLFYEMMGIDPDARISDWLSFVTLMPLGFGISFQLPLVMLFLERIGIFSVATYKSHWRISVLVIAFLSMILTPSDPGSMMLMATPLTALYFGGILLCHWMPRRTTPFGESIG